MPTISREYTAAGGFVLSLLTSLAGIPEADGGKSPFAPDDYSNEG